jgi:tetratricopeptide (TPR) repeat protein
VRRIRTGDTLYACLQQLQQDPKNADAIRRAVEGLLERSDPEGAIGKIKKFHAEEGHDHEVCRRLMFLAGRDLHYRVYLKAAKLYREGWPTTIEVPPVPGSKRLSELFDNGLTELDATEQAELMRTSRFEDASDLLGMVAIDAAAGDDLFGFASFAFRGGHYELAADLYRRWFEDSEAAHDADSLNRAAWQLYLAQESLETAVAMAREAYGLDPSADIADTLARLLYVSGDKSAAIELAKKAADQASGARSDQYREVAEKMKADRDLGDRPAFETYPGPREVSL